MDIDSIYNLSEVSRQVLGDFSTLKVWTAWRNEKRTTNSGKVNKTKVPYATPRLKTRSDDPSTWVSAEHAITTSFTSGFINGGGGGFGIYLGIDCGDGYLMGGIDLDTCLTNSAITDWAKEILDRFNSYSEISPSGTGVKLWFQYRKDHLPAIRAAMKIAEDKWSRMFKERRDGDHAPGFELHIGHRYFATTLKPYGNYPREMRRVSVDDIRWLIEEIGTRFTEANKAVAAIAATDDDDLSRQGGQVHDDNSRSARAMRRLTSLYHDGLIHTPEAGKAKLLNDDDPAIVEWMNEKGVYRNGYPNDYEFRRMWKKVKSIPRDYDRIQRELAESSGEPGPEIEDDDAPETEEASASEWPEPMDIFGALTHEPVMMPDMLPEKIRPFVYDQAELLGCDVGSMGMACLAVCSALISDAITIQPMQYNELYTERACLWLLLVGQISNKKTPLLAILTDVIRQEQALMKRQYDRDKLHYQDTLELYQAKRKAWATNQAKGGDDEAPQRPEKPREKRLMTNDFTNEALAEILGDNPRGMLLFLDEIMSLFGGFDAYRSNKGKDRPITLEGYNGGPRDIDRKGSKDDRIHVPNWSFSVVGGIQHSKLDIVGGQLASDGLLQRFMIVPMEPPTRGIDRQPDHEAVKVYTMLLHNLIYHDPPLQSVKPITLSPGAAKYVEQIEDLKEAFQVWPGLSEPFQAYAGKFGGTFARLLLTLHVIENCPGWGFNEDREERQRLAVVSEQTARRAYDLMTKFIVPHGIRQYERLDTKTAETQQVKDARWFAGHVLAKGLSEVTNRTFHDASKDFRTGNRAAKCADFLVAAAWLRDGQVNPRVHEIYAERAEIERTTRARRQAAIQRGRETISKIWETQK